MTMVNTPGYYAIMTEIKKDISVNRDHFGDVYGSNIAWMFGLADYMWHWCGEIMPGYRPNESRFEMSEGSPEIDALMDIIDEWEDADVRQVFKVISRYDDWLTAAGRGY